MGSASLRGILLSWKLGERVVHCTLKEVPCQSRLVAMMFRYRARFTRTATFGKVRIRPFEFVPVVQRIERRFPNSIGCPSHEGSKLSRKRPKAPIHASNQQVAMTQVTRID